MMIANMGSSPHAQGRPLRNTGNTTAPALRVSEAGRMALAQVAGPLDAESSARVMGRLLALCGPSRRIVLDLRRTEFVDSAGIRALLRLQVHAEKGGAELRLVTQPGAQVHKVLGLLRLDSRFQLFSTVVDAWISRWPNPRESSLRQHAA